MRWRAPDKPQTRNALGFPYYADAVLRPSYADAVLRAQRGNPEPRRSRYRCPRPLHRREAVRDDGKGTLRRLCNAEPRCR